MPWFGRQISDFWFVLLKPSNPLELFVSQRSALVDYATLLVGDRGRAEDVVQEAFLRFAPTLQQGTVIEEPVRYLYRIIRNLAFDLGRRKTRERRHEEGEPEWWMVPDAPRTPEENLIEAETVSRFQAAMARLPKETRIAIEMHRIGGHTLSEVSGHLGLSLATVHRMVARGMARILTEMAEGDA
jgi:RNA polymerase sigma factor (sigma-70 family)